MTIANGYSGGVPSEAQRFIAKTAVGRVYKTGVGLQRIRVIDAKFVNSSDRAIINSWWSTNAKLIFTTNDAAHTTSCTIVNRTQPFGKIETPYALLFNGKIELQDY